MAGIAIQEIRDACGYIWGQSGVKPNVALVLGSGLGSFADCLSVDLEVNTRAIPNYPQGTVQGHAGRIIFGTIDGPGITSLPLILFQGRVHYYETGQVDRVIFPIALAHELGARTLIVTNAAGGINPNFQAGQLMLIKDCLNLAQRNPSFPSSEHRQRLTSATFDVGLQALARESANKIGLQLQEGVYCWLHGPSYETSAEIRMLRTLGADAVGMSTVPEVYAASRLGMRIAGLSLISNMATGISTGKLSHEEVTETADRTQESFSRLMKEFILSIR